MSAPRDGGWASFQTEASNFLLYRRASLRVLQIPPIAVNPIPGICGMGFVGLVGLPGLVGLSLINH